jgi:hypothetical protein
MDLPNEIVKDSIYGLAELGPHVLGSEMAVLLRQGKNLSCYKTL